ncbi:PEP-utilizing enzyme [Nocardiopsis metallicus]|nr:PEP-utilizing enzyme [Nocardiopsis metallicus]
MGIDQLREVVAHLLDQPPTAIDLAVSPAAAGEVLGQAHLAAALWLPSGLVPTEVCRRVLLGEHGIGVWTGQPGTPAGRLSAYSFGPLALRAHTHCVGSGCSLPGATAEVAARHLVQKHRVPLAGPRPGLAPWDDGEQRARLLLGGKDVALRRLAVLLKEARVDTGLSVTWQEWLHAPHEVLAAITARYPEKPVIVRSCSSREDGWEYSQAGAFSSVPVRLPAQPEEIARAVDEVFGSYGGCGPQARVLIQQWLHPVQAAGVVTTRTLAGGPYYTATVDLLSGRTDTVTSGASGELQSWYIRRTPAPGRGWSSAGLPSAVARLVGAAMEAEVCTGTNRLDVEVALSDGAAHLLQARPLTTAQASDDQGACEAVERAQRQIAHFTRGHKAGDEPQVVLSNMVDWNPAEMLGRHPAPLAVSLYQTLITDRTWAAQRSTYGYRDLRGTPLMHLIAGAPYINATASLASFLPAALEEPLARTILTAMVERLVADPKAHDKIEFEIAATCWTPHISHRITYMTEAGIGSTARRTLHEQLLALTRRGIGRLPTDLAELDRIAAPTPVDTRLDRLPTTLAKARSVAMQFAHLARAAFMATDLISVLREEGLVTRREAWMRGLGTVTTVMRQDAAAAAAGQLPWSDFVARYRWIRPGTYDLTIPTYGDDPDGYLRPLLAHPLHSADDAVSTPWAECDAAAVDRAVAPLGLDAGALEAFCRAAITGRERGKAVYSAWVSAALEAVAAHGASRGIDRDGMRYLHLSEILRTHPGRWPGLIARRRAQAQACALVELPDVITSAEDLDCFERGRGRANFVGSARACGPVHATLSPDHPPSPGSVIVLEAADPGYDWIFAHQPAALVTAYGGANSHMAIRCAEAGIPAAIGVGLATHASCSAARRLIVDAGAQRLDVLP